MVTPLPVTGTGPPAPRGEDARRHREQAIRAGVLTALGRPGDLYRVAVLPLWGNHYRVNVVTGADPAAARIPHSYFLAADARGNIIEAAPPIVRRY